MRRLILSALAMICGLAANAQQDLKGDWQGVLKAGGAELHIIFHISDSSAVSMDVIEQGAKDIPASGMSISGDSIQIGMSSIKSSYAGVRKGADQINGYWKQGGMSFPLDIKRNEKPVTFNRPQTPKAPFKYKSEDVEFQNSDKSVTFGGTLTLPSGKGPFPTVLLISGSGRQNRDEELFGHKPFAVVADHLSDKGYAVLRVDDRGTGKTTGDVPDLTSADFVKDASAAIDYLKTRKDINQKKIGIAGHSEGGMIAQMLATQRQDMDFIILLAGPGVRSSQLMMEQNAAILKANGARDEVIGSYLRLYDQVVQSAIHPGTKIEVKERIATAVKRWRSETDPEIVRATTGITDNTSEQVVSEKMAQDFLDPWIRYFLAYDPQPYLEKLQVKVLALNGDKDVQVVATSNLRGLEAGLAKSKSKQYTVKAMPGLNHLFQTCNKCTVAEYAQLEETFSPLALHEMSDWLDKYVK